ncbi:hypothetical protein QQX98_004944 [Neonectria punicea]|uniref:Major facilitator superfamily (MFS) profile domain-containing protein n=1 Tax=Neonectria punicea TaxID=979145 RepID=A0ABR1H6Z4_9HYPO
MSDDETLGPCPRRMSVWNLLFDQARVDDPVLHHQYRGKGTAEDPFIVAWIPDDPGNPHNWPTWLRWMITVVSAFTCFVVAFSSSAYTGTMTELMIHFEASDTLITAGVSLYVLGFALGPLIWAPLSEMYGRQIVFGFSYGAYAVFSAGCTADNGVATLLVLRFFAGAFGSSPLTNAGGVISDVFEANERSIAMGVFSLAPAMGPTFGPFIGGYLGEDEGWRWVMGLMAILAGFAWMLGVALVPETYAPVILKKRSQALSKEVGKVFKTELEVQGASLTPAQIVRTALYRPLALLFAEPIVLILSIYTAILYGTLYMLFGAYPVVFQLQRGWTPGKGGLAFLGIAVGMFAAVPTVALINRWYVKKARESKGPLAPEMRLPGGMIGSIALPAGMFWFAWTTYSSVYWLSPVAAGVPFGFGLTLIFTAVFSYLIDAYTIYAASALAANTVLRSLFGAAFPLFTRQMYDKLGTQWASSLPGFLALACVPLPFVLWKHGPAIRKKCKYAARALAASEMDERIDT